MKRDYTRSNKEGLNWALGQRVYGFEVRRWDDCDESLDRRYFLARSGEPFPLSRPCPLYSNNEVLQEVPDFVSCRHALVSAIACLTYTYNTCHLNEETLDDGKIWRVTADLGEGCSARRGMGYGATRGLATVRSLIAALDVELPADR